MGFAVHSDISEHPVFSALSSKAYVLWNAAGQWTSRFNSRGYVPDRAITELNNHRPHRPFTPHVVEELVTAGVWTRVDGGYRMEYGPGDDWPLPLWKYVDVEFEGEGIMVLEDPDA